MKRDGGATDDADPSPLWRATEKAAGAVAKKPSSIDSTQMKSIGDDFGEAEIWTQFAITVQYCPTGSSTGQ